MCNVLLNSQLALASSTGILNCLNSSRENLVRNSKQVTTAIGIISKNGLSKSVAEYMVKTNPAMESFLPNIGSMSNVSYSYSKESLQSKASLLDHLQYCNEGLCEWVSEVKDEVISYTTILQERIDDIISSVNEAISNLHDGRVAANLREVKTNIINKDSMQSILDISIQVLNNLEPLNVERLNSDVSYRTDVYSAITDVVNTLSTMNGLRLDADGSLQQTTDTLSADYIVPVEPATPAEQGYNIDNVESILSTCLTGLNKIRSMVLNTEFTNSIKLCDETDTHTTTTQTPSQDIIDRVEQAGNDESAVIDNKPHAEDYSVSDIQTNQDLVQATNYIQCYTKLLTIVCDNIINATASMMTISYSRD